MGLLLHVQDVRPQVSLTSSANMPRVGDNIHHRQVQYFSPGSLGEEQVWDFRDLSFNDDIQPLTFFCDSDSVILYASTPMRLYKYVIAGDTLKSLGYETMLKAMTYAPAVPVMTFPCFFGNRMLQSYHGLGNYCNKYTLETSGTIESEVDATGTILLHDSDTLHNVIRVHLISTAGIRQYLPEDTLPEKTNVKQRIEERYLWYARGYRYPVIESNSITIYNDMLPVSCQQTAYCTLPADQIMPDDSINQKILMEDSLERAIAEIPPIIHYTYSVNPGAVHVHYSLDASATINAIVCDRMGVVYRRASESGNAGASGILHIDTVGLKAGIYILYLNVNGQVFNEKIEL